MICCYPRIHQWKITRLGFHWFLRLCVGQLSYLNSNHIVHFHHICLCQLGIPIQSVLFPRHLWYSQLIFRARMMNLIAQTRIQFIRISSLNLPAFCPFPSLLSGASVGSQLIEIVHSGCLRNPSSTYLFEHLSFLCWNPHQVLRVRFGCTFTFLLIYKMENYIYDF